MSTPTLFEINTTTSTTTSRRPLTAPSAHPRPVERCESCDDEKTVFARGRAWCVICDEDELFGEGVER